VNVKFEARFSKDFRAIREQKLLSKVKEVIDDCKSASSLSAVVGYAVRTIFKTLDYLLLCRFIDFFGTHSVPYSLAIDKI
jgi:hypothetical protein